MTWKLPHEKFPNLNARSVDPVIGTSSNDQLQLSASGAWFATTVQVRSNEVSPTGKLPSEWSAEETVTAATEGHVRCGHWGFLEGETFCKIRPPKLRIDYHVSSFCVSGLKENQLHFFGRAFSHEGCDLTPWSDHNFPKWPITQGSSIVHETNPLLLATNYDNKADKGLNLQ